MRMQNGTSTLENIWAISYEVKYITEDQGIPLLSTQEKNVCPTTCTQMFTAALFTEPKGGNNQNKQMLEKELGFIHGIPLNNRKEQITNPHNNMGESQKHYAK